MREVSLVSAELVDALNDFAEVFRQKAAMEFQRAEGIEIMADKIKAGGHADGPDIAAAQAWEREYGLLQMRFDELNMRCNRLILEHGDN